MRMRTIAAFAPATAQAERKPQHCVLDLSAKGSMSCFATFTEVVAAVTGGRVTTAALFRPRFSRRLDSVSGI